MKIIHKHFDSIGSTQQALIDSVTNNSETNLISARVQSSGFGRKGNKWDQYENSVSFSFKIDVGHLKIKSVIPLSVGVGICNFLNESYNGNQLKLKWPNDILDKSGNKVCGILCKLVDDIAIVGVGINIGCSPSNNTYQTKKGFITDKELSLNEYKEIPYNLFNYLLSRPIDHDFKLWDSLCFHKDLIVDIVENELTTTGKFIGIGEYGEALLLVNNEIKKVFNGSLILH